MRFSKQTELRSLKRLVCLALCLIGLAPAVAAEWKPRPGKSSFVESGLTLEQAIERVQKRHGGRIVAATPMRREGRSQYRIRVDVDGRVKTFFVDKDGRISGR